MSVGMQCSAVQCGSAYSCPLADDDMFLFPLFFVFFLIDIRNKRKILCCVACDLRPLLLLCDQPTNQLSPADLMRPYVPKYAQADWSGVQNIWDDKTNTPPQYGMPTLIHARTHRTARTHTHSWRAIEKIQKTSATRPVVHIKCSMHVSVYLLVYVSINRKTVRSLHRYRG